MNLASANSTGREAFKKLQGSLANETAPPSRREYFEPADREWFKANQRLVESYFGRYQLDKQKQGLNQAQT